MRGTGVKPGITVLGARHRCQGWCHGDRRRPARVPAYSANFSNFSRACKRRTGRRAGMRARGITRARKRGREDERPKTSARNVRATGKRALSPGAAHSHACERCACPCRPAAAARLPRRFGPDRHSWDGGTGESAVRPGLTRPCMPPRLTFATKKLSTSAQGQKEVPPFRRSPRPPPMQLRIRQRLGTARDDSEAVLCLRWFQKALAFKI